jgi:hypothetical protein
MGETAAVTGIQHSSLPSATRLPVSKGSPVGLTLPELASAGVYEPPVLGSRYQSQNMGSVRRRMRHLDSECVSSKRSSKWNKWSISTCREAANEGARVHYSAQS